MSDADKAKYSRHAEIILLDLLSAHEGDDTKYIGYSRGKPNFARGGGYWDAQSDHAVLSERIFLTLIDFLNDTGFLENHIADAGHGGFSSRMKATPQLADYFRDHELNWTSMIADPDAQVIFVKDEKKDLISLPEPGDFDLDAAVANVRRINANLQTSYINLSITDLEYEDLRNRIVGHDALEDEPREPLEFSNRTLRRIFALGGYENGGRFYGGWWQGLPGKYRKFIEIEGAVTVEMDFISVQPYFMYANVGQDLPKDTYIPPDWPPEVRPYGKKAFNQLINSDPTSRNENQWHRFAPNIELQDRPLVWENLPEPARDKVRRKEFENVFGRPYSDLLRDLLRMHKPIDDYFFSKAWGPMQRLDSDIAERVMIKLLDADVPITALPIHDSFIVTRGGEWALIEAMYKASEELVGVRGEVDINEAVYHRPKGIVDPLPLILGRDLAEETRDWIKNHYRYIQREREWERQYGPIG